MSHEDHNDCHCHCDCDCGSEHEGEYEPFIVTDVLDDGTEVHYEFIGHFEFEGALYAQLVPCDEGVDQDEDLIMECHVNFDEDTGRMECEFIPIEDDALFQRIVEYIDNLPEEEVEE